METLFLGFITLFVFLIAIMAAAVAGMAHSILKELNFISIEIERITHNTRNLP